MCSKWTSICVSLKIKGNLLDARTALRDSIHKYIEISVPQVAAAVIIHEIQKRDFNTVLKDNLFINTTSHLDISIEFCLSTDCSYRFGPLPCTWHPASC